MIRLSAIIKVEAVIIKYMCCVLHEQLIIRRCLQRLRAARYAVNAAPHKLYL